MEIILDRVFTDTDRTLGIMLIDGNFQCFTLEDTKREIKIDGETRIPAGRYQVTLREVVSPLTVTYRDKYDYFDFHLMLNDVPNYENVYIHVGNHKDNTEGCILVGDSLMNPNKTNLPLQQSGNAFKDSYIKIRDAIRASEVWITVID